METVKIKSTDNSVFGKQVVLPIDGETSVSADGILEVSEAAAKLLVENTSDYTYLPDPAKAKETKKAAEKAEKPAAKKKVETVEETEEETEEEEDDSDEDTEEEETEDEDTDEDDTDSEDEDSDDDETEETEDDEEDEPAFTKESLQTLEISDLVAILKEAKVDEAKYAKLIDKKGLLINYILKNVQ